MTRSVEEMAEILATIRKADRDRYHANAEKRREYDRKRRAGVRMIEPDPVRRRARARLAMQVYRGKIKKPTACQGCGLELPARSIHGHHHDYSKPLDVEWLCAACHGERHRNDTPWPV